MKYRNKKRSANVIDSRNNKRIVLVLGPSLSVIGGVTTHLRQLFYSDISREFTFRHFQVGSVGENEDNRSKILRFVFSPISLIKTILSVRPCIVHFNTSMDYKAFWRDIVYLIISKMFMLRTVYQIHGGDLPQDFFRSRLMSYFLKKALQLPDVVVVLAQTEKDAYQRFARLKRLSLVPNAIQVDHYSKDIHKNYDEKVLRIIYLGRIIIEKGIMDVIEAFRILKNDACFSRIRFDIAGSGPDEQLLQHKVAEFGLSEKIAFHGPLYGSKKLRFWQHAHIYAFPTYREGFPYTVLESLSSGTPLITTRVGGIPDAVIQNKHGLFVKPRDPDNLARVIKRMESDRNLLKKMSIECLDSAYKNYSVERLSGQFLKLYLSLLK